MEIVQNRRKGLWNVPYINSAYLIRGPFIHDPATRPNFVFGLLGSILQNFISAENFSDSFLSLIFFTNFHPKTSDRYLC
jgi:hypothetical protein